MHYFYELTCNSDKNNFSTNLNHYLHTMYSWESNSTQKLFSGCLPRQHHQYPQLKFRPLQRSLQHLLLLLQTSKPLQSCLSQQHHPQPQLKLRQKSLRQKSLRSLHLLLLLLQTNKPLQSYQSQQHHPQPQLKLRPQHPLLKCKLLVLLSHQLQQ